MHAVIENLGGWQKLPVMSYKELAFVRKNFEKIYPALSKSPRETTKVLLGITDTTNATKGYELTKPSFIKCPYIPKTQSKTMSIEQSKLNQLTQNIGKA
jgi:hypothetical protein